MRRRTGLVAVLAAMGVSILGSRMSFVAIPWLVLVNTDSPTKMGLVAGAEMLPYVLASAVGAPLSDRIGNRRTAIAADLASAAVMVAIAAVATAGFGLLVVLVAVAGGLRGLGDNAKKVMCPPEAARAGVPLVRVATVHDGMSRLAMMVGAAVAGVLISWTGATTAIIVNAVAFVGSALLLLAATRPPTTETGTPGRKPMAKEPYLAALHGGFRHVWRDRIAFGVITMLFGINLFNQASGVVFIPVWAAEVMNSPAAIGLLLGVLSLGAVLGNIAFTVLATRVPRYATFTLGFLLGGPPRFLVLAISDNLAVILTVTFLSGLALASVNPIISAMTIERTPPELHGRVFGLNTAVAWAGIPLGGVLGGWAVQAIGLAPALIVTGGLYLLVALVPVVGYRSWRAIADPPPRPVNDPVAGPARR